MTIRAVLVAATLGLVGCAGPDSITSASGGARLPSPSKTADQDLVFLANAPGAPSLATTTVSFWAHTQQDREASIFYHARAGQSDSTELVRFRVDKGSLKTRPDGSAFGVTDSILITMTVSDSARLVVDMQPSGLTFDSNRPARIWFKWTEANPDRNDDGVVNAVDDSLTLVSRVWKQEGGSAPWQSLKTSVDAAQSDYAAKVTGFTRYAVAY